MLYLCHLTIRPWVVKHYGNNEVVDMPLVTTMFAPMCQRMFGQNLPVLLSVRKGPVSLMWFHIVFWTPFINSNTLSISSCNAIPFSSCGHITSLRIFCIFNNRHKIFTHTNTFTICIR